MPNPAVQAEKHGFSLEPYDPTTKKFTGTCRCGTRGTLSYSMLTSKSFCRNPDCDFFSPKKKLDHAEMTMIAEERGCKIISLSGSGVKTKIEFICVCGFQQKNTWLRFYNNAWCHHFSCQFYRKIKDIDPDLIKDWFEFENYKAVSDIKYNGKNQSFHKVKFEVQCPSGHLHITSLNTWVDGSRCKTCHGNGRTLSYSQIKNFYQKHGCEILYTEDDYTGNVTENVIPYICPMGHVIDNLTKNCFNTRLNGNLGPCSKCVSGRIGSTRKVENNDNKKVELDSKKDVCVHGKKKYRCRDCRGYCTHTGTMYKCTECGGVAYCVHKRLKYTCSACNPNICLVNRYRPRVTKLRPTVKIEGNEEYIGCPMADLKEYLESKMTPEMTWYNIHIDHIKPISRFNLEDKLELLRCCHYTNLQPLLCEDNRAKKNKWSQEDEENWQKNICGVFKMNF